MGLPINIAMNINPGWVTEKDLMVIGKYLPQGKITVFEVGTGYGRSAVFMAETNPEAEIYTIDDLTAKSLGGGLEKEQCREIIGRNFSSYQNIHFIEGDSHNYVWDKEIDFLFIDGNHQYHSIKADFENYCRWVKPGGIVLFHDISTSGRELIDVKEYLDDLGIEYEIDGNIAIWKQKTDKEILEITFPYRCGGITDEDVVERIDYVRKLRAGEIMIDYGTGGLGRMAIAMAMANPLALVYTFESGIHRHDWNEGEYVALISGMITKHKLNNLLFKIGDGTTVLLGWKQEIAGINIDVDGTESALRKSVKRWFPLVKKGGRIFFQNYGQQKYPFIGEIVNGLDKEKYKVEKIICDSAIVTKL